MALAHRCRSCRRLPFALVVAALVLGPGRAACGQEARSLKERFLTEAPKAWEEYLSFAVCLSGRMRTQSTVSGPDGEVVPGGGAAKFEIKQKEGHHLIAYEAGAGLTGASAIVQAASSRYAFQLTRPKGKTDWLLSQLDLKAVDGSTVGGEPTPLRERLHHDVARHFEVDGLPLSSLLHQPTFKVLRATTVKRDGLALVRIDFDNAHPLPSRKTTGKYVFVQSGSLLFDPDHSWCLAESEIMRVYAAADGSGPFQRPIKATYEYRVGTGRFPILTRTVSGMKPVPEKKNNGVDYVFEYDLRESPAPEDEEFTLTAYGLPEPVGMPLPHRSRAWLWFSLAGVVALAVGFWFRKAARRWAAVQPAGPQAIVLK